MSELLTKEPSRYCKGAIYLKKKNRKRRIIKIIVKERGSEK